MYRLSIDQGLLDPSILFFKRFFAVSQYLVKSRMVVFTEMVAVAPRLAAQAWHAAQISGQICLWCKRWHWQCQYNFWDSASFYTCNFVISYTSSVYWNVCNEYYKHENENRRGREGPRSESRARQEVSQLGASLPENSVSVGQIGETDLYSHLKCCRFGSKMIWKKMHWKGHYSSETYGTTNQKRPPKKILNRGAAALAAWRCTEIWKKSWSEDLFRKDGLKMILRQNMLKKSEKNILKDLKRLWRIWCLFHCFSLQEGEDCLKTTGF